MACIFCDLDGTFFYWGTERPLPGAVEHIKFRISKGHQVIFTTQRDEEWAQKAVKAIKALGIDARVLHDIQNPRVVINDGGAYAINHPRDQPWPLFGKPDSLNI